MKRGQSSIWSAVVLCLAAASVVPGQEAGKPADQETVVRLDVSPAAPPDPALRYTLVPQLVDRTPGSAAPLYLNAFSLLNERVTFKGKQREFYEVLDELMEKPIGELDDEDSRSFVSSVPSVIDLMSHAARRERAGWDNTLREQGFEALLPYLNRVRTAARFVELRARVELAQGHVTEALQTSTLIFAMADHLREDAVLVQALVGVGVMRGALSEVIEPLVQAPGAPNLYWALASLPRPVFDMREAMGWEKVGVRSSLSPLRYRSAEKLSAEEWGQVAREFSRMLTFKSSPPTPSDQVESTALAVVYYPRAKQELIDAGYSADQVNAMPSPQVIGMAMMRTFDHWTDEVTKYASLPYYQARPLMKQVSKDLMAAKNKDPLNPAFALLPAVDRAFLTLAELDRRVAILQAVEAIRAYAARHAGALPKSLADIVETPVPTDPMTGRAFAYKVTGDATAELVGPASEGEKKSRGVRYVITMRKQ